MRRRIFGIPIICLLLAACTSAPVAEEGPGPKRPRGPDPALDAATPVDVNDEDGMRAWLAERVTNARAGRSERVRVPIIRRGPFGCDCPMWGIGPTPLVGPFTWLHVVDLTGAGLPDDEQGWAGWAEGRFTGKTEVFRSTDGTDGMESELPVLEVFYARSRSVDDEPVVRAARD